MNNNFLTLILQNLVLFPNQEVKLEFKNELSKKIVNTAFKSSKELIFISPKDNIEIRPNIKDLPKIGCFCEIKNCLELPNKALRVTIRGLKRVKIKTFSSTKDNLIMASFESVTNQAINIDEENAYIRKIKSLVEEYISLNSKESNNILRIIKNVTNLSKLVDMISAYMNFNYEKKYELFKELNCYTRAKKLINLLSNEILSLKLESKIDDEIRSNFEKNEKEFILKEMINRLNKELGLESDKHVEAKDFRNKVEKLSIDKKIKEGILREIKRFEMTLDSSPEFSVIRSHLEFLTSLPWNTSTKDNADIKAVNRALNETHYGLEAAKTRIEEYFLLHKHNKDLHSPILCLVGPPGTGKTTFARELAKSIGREFIKISVGGLNDSSELVGHRRTYIGACPGKIMEGIRKCGVNNPIILIDEVDKMLKDYKGDPASVLLDILDPNQNREFIDNYVAEPFDLSNVIFILTANDEQAIPRALLDRLEVIEVSSYTILDKIEIAKNYTLPRLGKEYKFDHSKIKFSDNVLSKIINEYTKEAGMRELERQISSIIRKVIIAGADNIVTIKEKDIVKYLGKNKYLDYDNTYTSSGIVNVPAYSETGGNILNIECSIYPGVNKIMTTGSLGDVMKESAYVSLSFIRENASKLKLDTKKLNNSTIHIHALDGASRKDGPSAGLAITVSIVSKLLDKKVPNDVAFTGEISLSGRILRIGKLKEKLISAYNNGIKKVYIPIENVGDLEKIPTKILKNINVKPVNNFTEVYTDLFD